jgi:hypothetical protein
VFNNPENLAKMAWLFGGPQKGPELPVSAPAQGKGAPAIRTGNR